MTLHIDLALDRFSKGFNCSRSVFATYCELFNVDELAALRVSGSFGGGMGRLGEACGALTGAFMLIGCKLAMTSEGDSDTKDRTYLMVREFTSRFKKIHSYITCRNLITGESISSFSRRNSPKKFPGK